MIQLQSRLIVSDNTGARSILCIRILGNTKKTAYSGNIIIGVIKRALPVDPLKKKLPSKPGKKTLTRIVAKKSEIALALIIRVKTFLSCNNGTLVSFDDNAATLITSDKNPRATKIHGPISSKIRGKEFSKLISLAAKVI